MLGNSEEKHLNKDLKKTEDTNKSCAECKFCIKLEKHEDGQETAHQLTLEDTANLDKLHEKFVLKCYKNQWNEKLHPELKRQDLYQRTCEHFLSREENSEKTFDQIEREQVDESTKKRHKETIKWMRIGFLVAVISILIATFSMLPSIVERMFEVKLWQ